MNFEAKDAEAARAESAELTSLLQSDFGRLQSLGAQIAHRPFPDAFLATESVSTSSLVSMNEINLNFE